jgi:hypothetical protein
MEKYGRGSGAWRAEGPIGVFLWPINLLIVEGFIRSRPDSQLHRDT